jgi:hypothetical protein
LEVARERNRSRRRSQSCGNPSRFASEAELRTISGNQAAEELLKGAGPNLAQIES